MFSTETSPLDPSSSTSFMGALDRPPCSPPSNQSLTRHVTSGMRGLPALIWEGSVLDPGKAFRVTISASD